MSAPKNLVGQKFGRLTVIKRVDNYVSPKGRKKSRWLCKCDCGNETIVISTDLTGGKTFSCGCFQKEQASKYSKIKNHKTNEYDLTNEYSIGYTSNEKEFYFDLEDYDKIKDYCWHINNGYVYAVGETHNGTMRTVALHRIVMNCPDNMVVDHINHNKLDNRKANLRTCTQIQNCRNKSMHKNNTSGTTGVSFSKYFNKWHSYICTNGCQILLGYFDNIEDAIAARKEAEEKYFGEYRYTG